MKTGHKIAALGCLAVVTASVAYWRWMIRIPLKEFTRYALYMAVMDDEICRNELEGNQIGDTVIAFPPREESLQERYHLILKMNRTKSRRQLQAEIAPFSGFSKMEYMLCGAPSYFSRSGYMSQ